MLSEEAKREVLTELFNSERVTLTCGKHTYFGPIKGRPEVVPALGCKDCWRVFYVSEMASTPPNERRQKLEEIEDVLHRMIEMVEKGTWDFEPYEHAQISIGSE